MFQRTKNRKAISTVLTTMIILVASVVLGTGVVLYGTSLFQTNASSSGITVTGTQVWVDSKTSSGWAWGAFDVRNSGDKLLSVDQIQIRGQAIPFANWYFDTDTARVTSTNFQQALNYSYLQSTVTGQLKNYTGSAANPNCPGPAPIAMNLIGSSSTNPVLCLSPGSGPISLAPGGVAIVYFKVQNGLLTTIDAGSASSVAVYAGKVGSPVSVTVAAK